MAIERRSSDRIEERARMARALAEGGFTDVLVVECETAAKLLTGKRQELLARIEAGEVESVRGLARDLGRDKAAVSRDLDLLFRHDVVEYDSEDNRKIPRLKHETVVAEPLV